MIPCDTCGAAADEPCAEDCPDMAYASEGGGVLAVDAEPAEWVDEETDTLTLARRTLFRAATRLPVGALCGDPPYFGEDTDPDQWLGEMAVWLARYSQVINAHVDDLQEQARQRVGLQLERDILRQFLGEAINEKLETVA